MISGQLFEKTLAEEEVVGMFNYNDGNNSRRDI
jgi:hypothetical protein